MLDFRRLRKQKAKIKSRYHLPCKTKIIIRRFRLRGWTYTREMSETTDRVEHRGSFGENPGLGPPTHQLKPN
jgi:hypothetical protein